jgi:hypothetical protein
LGLVAPALFVPKLLSMLPVTLVTSANFAAPTANVSVSATDGTVRPQDRCAIGFEPGTCV